MAISHANLHSKHPLLFIGAVSGLALTFTLEVIYADQFTLLFKILATLLIGSLVGLALTRSMKKPYAVAIIATLYVYATSFLLSTTQLIHFAVYAFLLTLSSVGLFYLSDRYFNELSFGFKKKLILAVGVWLFFYVICAQINLYINRLVAPLYIY